MIYVARHGQTDWNKRRVFNGVTDVSLNDTGIQQAIKMKEDMKGLDIDICYCSPQIRAVQCAEIVYGNDYIIDDRLTEIVCGDFEGTEETVDSFNAFWKATKNGDLGTEKFSDFVNRVCSFCEMLTQKYNEKSILVITHAANARVINYFFEGKDENYDFKSRVGGSGVYIAYDPS